VTSNLSSMCGISPDKSATHKKMVDEELELELDCEGKNVVKIDEASVEVLDADLK